MKPFLLLLAILFTLPACSYHFQGRDNALRELGVEKIYVAQFQNSSYRPGIEQLFSTAMIREIQKSGSFRLVNSEEEADAVMYGTVAVSDAGIASFKTQTVAGKEMTVASDYTAGVQCTVVLKDKNGRHIFTQSISSGKVYPGAFRVGDAGTTNALINDSEERLAIQFLASQMMTSVYQRMVDTF